VDVGLILATAELTVCPTVHWTVASACAAVTHRETQSHRTDSQHSASINGYSAEECKLKQYVLYLFNFSVDSFIKAATLQYKEAKDCFCGLSARSKKNDLLVFRTDTLRNHCIYVGPLVCYHTLLHSIRAVYCGKLLN
jgi:hypothetical protein